jgi:phosphohistidine phosphatase
LDRLTVKVSTARFRRGLVKAMESAMDRLILMRHGKAERHAPNGGDFERPLAERGRDDVRRIAQALIKAGLAPDLALVSTARRTRETWETLASALPAARVSTRRDLYHAEAEDILAALNDEAGEGATVLVVGHNPGLHELALDLAARGAAPLGLIAKLRGRFPTATAAVFSVDSAGKMRLDDLFLVADLGGHGGE